MYRKFHWDPWTLSCAGVVHNRSCAFKCAHEIEQRGEYIYFSGTLWRACWLIASRCLKLRYGCASSVSWHIAWNAGSFRNLMKSELSASSAKHLVQTPVSIMGFAIVSIMGHWQCDHLWHLHIYEGTCTAYAHWIKTELLAELAECRICCVHNCGH